MGTLKRDEHNHNKYHITFRVGAAESYRPYTYSRELFNCETFLRPRVTLPYLVLIASVYSLIAHNHSYL
jgi:hypothetical protein